MNLRHMTDRPAIVLVCVILGAGLVACGGGAVTSSSSEAATFSGPVGAEPCDSSSAADLTSIELDVAGETRAAVVHIAAGVEATEPLPLVLGFHGFGGTPQDLQGDSSLFEKADAEGFVAVLPAAVGNPTRWDLSDAETPDFAFVDALLTEVQRRVCIDPNRTYATGFSQGATMANAVGCSRPDRFAAIAPVAGAYAPTWRNICAGRPMPVIAFHGVLDPIVPYTGGTDRGGRPVIAAEEWAAGWAEMNGCAGGPQPQPSIGDVQPLFWSGCAAAVEFYRVTQAGHSWPGGVHDDPEMGGSSEAVSANDLMWSFFQRHSLTG